VGDPLKVRLDKAIYYYLLLAYKPGGEKKEEGRLRYAVVAVCALDVVGGEGGAALNALPPKHHLPVAVPLGV
jgi:hypothetical protein